MTNRMVNGTGAVLLALSGAAEAAYQWNLPTPVTCVAGEIYNLHLVLMGIILVIFIGVFGVMLYSIYAHRRSVGHRSEHFHENITVEIIWAIIPFLILIAVAWPATKSVLNLKDTASPGITIKVTGYQGSFPALDGSQLVNGPRGRQMEIVLNGKRGTAMAPFGKQLSDTDVAAAGSRPASAPGCLRSRPRRTYKRSRASRSRRTAASSSSLRRAASGPLLQNLVLEREEKPMGLKLQPFVIEQTSGAQDGLAREWPTRASTGIAATPCSGIRSRLLRRYSMSRSASSGSAPAATEAARVRGRRIG